MTKTNYSHVIHTSCEGCRDNNGGHSSCCIFCLKDGIRRHYTPVPPATYVSCPGREHPFWERRTKELLKEKDALDKSCTKLQSQRENLRGELERLIFVVSEIDFNLIQKCLDEN
jgi:hypothetical protein